MRFYELFDPDNEQALYQLGCKYFSLLNEYTDKHEEPPPKEMSQKLGLTIEEYSELKNFIANGGLDDIIRGRIADDLANGGTFLPDFNRL
jgi:hypothetical protein